jgi:hypothetical protein
MKAGGCWNNVTKSRNLAEGFGLVVISERIRKLSEMEVRKVD